MVIQQNEPTLISLNPNPLVTYLGKLPKDFTKEDIIKFVKDKDIKMVNLCHVGEDGRLKSLSFVINNEKHLNEILEMGERVDGSSLFSYINPKASDLYVVPKYRTAFTNPFNQIPTLNLLCACFDKNGNQLDIAPESILRKAQEKLFKNTRVTLEALGELEFYIVSKQERNDLYPCEPEKSYHESAPFVKWENLRNEILNTIAKTGAKVKYGHAEVGNIPDNSMEQHEIEFSLEPLEDIADHITIAKWIIRNIGARYGINITFAPKLRGGHAGSGLHVHICGYKNGKSIMTDSDGKLSGKANRMIGGLLKFAPSLTAFGNTVPISYLRFGSHQETPTGIYWGYGNRSALVRVPLGWTATGNMAEKINPGKIRSPENTNESRQTIELRTPDGSANIYLLLAGIAVAVEYGLTNRESIKLAEDLYVDTLGEKKRGNLNRLKTLPQSCHESAKCLEKDRKYYEKGNVLPKQVIDGVLRKLYGYNDKRLKETLMNDIDKANELIEQYLHFG
jgi:glutamine synthetase